MCSLVFPYIQLSYTLNSLSYEQGCQSPQLIDKEIKFLNQGSQPVGFRNLSFKLRQSGLKSAFLLNQLPSYRSSVSVGEGIPELGRQRWGNIAFNQVGNITLKDGLPVDESAFYFSKRSFFFCYHKQCNLTYEMHWELFSWYLENCQTSYPFRCYRVLISGPGTTAGYVDDTRVDRRWYCQKEKW